MFNRMGHKNGTALLRSSLWPTLLTQNIYKKCVFIFRLFRNTIFGKIEFIEVFDPYEFQCKLNRLFFKYQKVKNTHFEIPLGS